MAEDHRRVEPRAVVLGSGMAADPDRIGELQNRAARFERASRLPPEKAFGEILAADREARAQRQQPEDEEQKAKREAAERRTAEERQTIRRLMGSGTVHPEHGQGKRKVSLKG